MEIKSRSKTEQLIAPVYRFIELEYAGGIFLFASVLAALIWANSSFGSSYHHFWEIKLPVGYGSYVLDKPLHIWINDGLMAIFFFVIGLELKREFISGGLSTPQKAALPMVAALGGMLLPALIYFFINRGTGSARGWGIPMATDIAFALALISMSGKHIPPSVKVFLSALAVADDLGAILVIAFFYGTGLHLVPLGIAAVLLLILAGGNKLGIKHPAFYLLTGLGVWLGFLLSGIHATIAGVLVAFTVPSSILPKIENTLHPWVAFLIMPLFALANAGMDIGAAFFSSLINPVSLGVVTGLIAGKFIGVLLFTWLMIRFGWAQLPEQAGWKHIIGVAFLAGVGFTMSLFISNLAFENILFIEQAKYGILTASIVSGVLGVAILKYFKKS